MSNAPLYSLIRRVVRRPVIPRVCNTLSFLPLTNPHSLRFCAASGFSGLKPLTAATAAKDCFDFDCCRQGRVYARGLWFML